MPASAVILSSRRAILLVSLDRHEKFLLDFLPERDAIEIETRITKFDQLSIDLEKIQGQLEDLAITEEEIAHNAALRDDFEPRLIRAHSQLKAKRVHVPRSISSTPNAGPSPLVGIKLPTIALPEYDGDYMQWLTYRDTFEGLIHDNPELPPIQKFHYLRASLKGEAAKVIESITISAANYEIAWKILTERYSNEYLLKKRHLQALFGMATMKRESASTLHHLVDEFERHKKTLNHLVRALLDSASQPDLMSTRLAQRLALKLDTVNVTLIGAGHSSTPVRKSVRAKISSRTGQYQLNADFLIVDNLIGDLPAHDVRTVEWQIPPNFVLADPQFNKSAPLDLILGARHYHAFFQSGAQYKISHNLPVLIESVFGWIVTGSASACNSNTETSNASSVVCMSTLEESLERFWKVEELQIRDGYSPEERYCEKLYQDTTQRDDTGRYIVRLPKQPDFEEKLGLSKLSALRRFTMLERRLERDPHIKAAYHEFMHEYLELGHMSLIQAPADDESAYYLPHHPVFKASSTTTKTRVVFDGSAKTSSGYSLNEALCVGPAVQDDLLDIILRFRTYKVAVVGDIAKMYRQILLHPDDRKYARICFRFDSHSPIQYYELNTVTYGLSPSSFLATRTLQQLANDEGTTYPVAASALKSNFYVDDFIGGADSIESARRLRVELDELLSRGGFELRKWTSNRLEVLTGLTADQIGTQSALQFIPDETVKTLGVSWEPEHDVLSFESAIDTDTASPTKRSILSNIARMFDPLGLISPIVVRAKILMQELWLQKAGWDDLVPDSICKKWKNIQQDWPLISGFKIDRYALLPGSKLQLHTFCDASEAAYGACIYVRCESEQGEVRTTLLSSKSRVAPLKRVTLPRLELCAAVLGAHLYDRVKKAMGLHAAEVFFWSDSTVTLKWISASPNTWATFVGNRVSEVQHYTHPRQWRHVPGSTNPADMVSRGMSAADFLQSKLWSCGPEWLALPASNWPNCNPEPAEDTNLEIRQLHAIVTHRCILHSLHT
ncbi:uncharacterized protein LOC125767458 [Anopheles funestus]|uniref:uncharacterized protein LOC125767458 n=1 Tax=Anopheles funestus TaxID=62324 RepID=UPI0020C5BC0A|nr:uncharacterized protein LOC125767458 [Anopheles funestus]